ncbi:hypothetical protein [Sphingomonas sp. CARO-RG-8B-R24-01]|uniref:hypothetical protein n=1 Tax=Sphingomonas sp. CARO-RG-8B-R24-01 TaxID=2914831 RepID=UPI001F572787|nr:hypothetical protein [Sphingomonas sp. CARO-RG-8B-R24-01]
MMGKSVDQSCATCGWWERCGPKLANATRDPSSGYDLGTCQLHAPVVIQGDAPFPVSMFPQTHESRFCGDWEARQGGGGGDGGERIVAFPIDRMAA